MFIRSLNHATDAIAFADPIWTDIAIDGSVRSTIRMTALDEPGAVFELRSGARTYHGGGRMELTLTIARIDSVYVVTIFMSHFR